MKYTWNIGYWLIEKNPEVLKEKRNFNKPVSSF